MSKVQPHDSNAVEAMPVSDFFNDKSWVTINRNGVSLNYLSKNKDLEVSNSPFVERKNEPHPVQTINDLNALHGLPLCEQYKCAESCNKDCAKMNCYHRAHLKK